METVQTRGMCSSSFSPGEVTFVNIIYLHLHFIVWCTHIAAAPACVVLSWLFIIMNFHKEIIEVV